MEQLRIAVIEDNDKDAAQLSACIDRYFSSDVNCYELKRFTSASSLFDKFISYFDIILMDIEMPNMNGMEASRRIREINKEVVIIFVTNLAQFAVEGYSVNAFDFIIKPVDYSNFKLRFKRAIDYVESHIQKIAIRETGTIVRTVSVSQILFVEVFGHQIIYHTLSGNITERRSLYEVEKQLAPYGFFKCSNCYLVNLKFVESINNTTIKIGDAALEMSRRKKKEFMEALTNYYSEGV